MSVEIRVLLFARAREIAGSESLTLTLAEGATVGEVVSAVKEAVPPLEAYLSSCRLAVNQEFRDLDGEVPDGAEVAIIPPVSGGSR